MTTILSHQEDLGTIMLDVKYEGLGGTCLVTIPLNMAPNLSECNVSHGGIAQRTVNDSNKLSADCVHSTSINMFKNRIDNYLMIAGYT